MFVVSPGLAGCFQACTPRQQSCFKSCQGIALFDCLTNQADFSSHHPSEIAAFWALFFHLDELRLDISKEQMTSEAPYKESACPAPRKSPRRTATRPAWGHTKASLLLPLSDCFVLCLEVTKTCWRLPRRLIIEEAFVDAASRDCLVSGGSLI